MNCTIKASLEQRALTKIACILWNREDIRKSVSHFDLFSSNIDDLQREEQWERIVVILMVDMMKFHLPELLTERLTFCVDGVGRQILRWSEHLRPILGWGDVTKNLSKLCWAPHGTIDLKKTAEVLIKDGNLNMISRYKLACLHCIEDDIQALWNEMDEYCRESLLRIMDYDESLYNKWQQNLLTFWAHDMIGAWKTLDKWIIRPPYCSPFLLAFQCAAMTGNKVPAEFFLQKLNDKEKEIVVDVSRALLLDLDRDDATLSTTTAHPKKHYTDVLCFLFSQMNEKQQIEIFEGHSFLLLQCLLDWPYQSFFIDTLSRMWKFLSRSDYYKLLGSILDKVLDNYKDCNYKKLFEETWSQCPEAYERYDAASLQKILLKLYAIGDEHNFKLILKDATPAEKRGIIVCKTAISEILIDGEEWDILEYFIQECLSCLEDLVFFKGIMEEAREKRERDENLWNKFFELLEELIRKDIKKRSMEEEEEEESNSPKRFHSTE